MKKIMNLVLGLSLLALLLSNVALANKGARQFHGSVKSIEADILTIVTATNATVTFRLLPTTKFIKSNQPASLQDLKIGNRVVVRAMKNGQLWDAATVNW